jgi:hypothetical protein
VTTDRTRIGRLEIAAAEEQPHALARDRRVFLVGELERDGERHRPRIMVAPAVERRAHRIAGLPQGRASDVFEHFEYDQR